MISFDDPELADFAKFEAFFWNLMHELSVIDKANYPHDPRVDSDPTSPKYSFSVKKEAFFVIMLHPQSPRMARGFPLPTIVFNAHQQFEDLRKKGIFEKVRDLIRKRDKQLQGFINPMLNDFGTRSEALQYTGRMYESESKCPFHKLKSFFKKAPHTA